jgi:hypothetical protein
MRHLVCVDRVAGAVKRGGGKLRTTGGVSGKRVEDVGDVGSSQVREGRKQEASLRSWREEGEIEKIPSQECWASSCVRERGGRKEIHEERGRRKRAAASTFDRNSAPPTVNPLPFPTGTASSVSPQTPAPTGQRGGTRRNEVEGRGLDRKIVFVGVFASTRLLLHLQIEAGGVTVALDCGNTSIRWERRRRQEEEEEDLRFYC